MAKAAKSNNSVWGGVLAFLGSLVYLYVVFTWYTGSNGAISAGSWLSGAQFFAPFVVAFAFISAISLFFMSIGAAMNKMQGKMAMTLWKFVMLGGISFIILTGGMGVFFWEALLGFLLTYLGGMAASMDM